LAAYSTAIKLLPQLAALHLDLPSRQQILSTAKGITLSSDAAACAVNFGQYNTAVEFLEASRSVFWSQAFHLRAPLDPTTVPSDLSGKLRELSRQLEQASFRDTSRNLLTDSQRKIMSIESESAHFRQLQNEWDQVVKDVQMLPGFEHFTKPKTINALKKAAVSGPIIILTTTNSTGLALIVTATNEVQCLKLPKMTLPSVMALANLFRALSDQPFDFEVLASNDSGGRSHQYSEVMDRMYGGREGSIDVDPNDVFCEFLAELWNTIVKPVLDVHNLKASKPFSMHYISPYVFAEIR
jgi:hypothetical protein